MHDFLPHVTYKSVPLNSRLSSFMETPGTATACQTWLGWPPWPDRVGVVHGETGLAGPAVLWVSGKEEKLQSSRNAPNG